MGRDFEVPVLGDIVGNGPWIVEGFGVSLLGDNVPSGPRNGTSRSSPLPWRMEWTVVNRGLSLMLFRTF